MNNYENGENNNQEIYDYDEILGFLEKHSILDLAVIIKKLSIRYEQKENR